MNKKLALKIAAPLLGIAFALGAPQGAQAAPVPTASPNNFTQACTQISNTATVNFTVGGVGQTPGASNAASFQVGNRANVLVVKQNAAPVSVVPGSAGNILTFKVINAGNYRQRYNLASLVKAIGTANPFAGLPANSTFTATEQVPAIYVDGAPGAVTANIDPDFEQTVTILADIGAAQVDGDLSVHALTATTTYTTGAAVTQGAGQSIVGGALACTGNVGDVVFADTVAGPDDAVRDAVGSDRDAYKVCSSLLSFSKTATTIWDPINYTTIQKTIPGALVRYVVTVSNAGAACRSAVLTTITDGLSGNLTMDANLKVAAAAGPLTALADESAAGKGFKVLVTGSARALNGVAQYFTTANDADGVELLAPNITATLATVLPVEGAYLAGEIKPGETVTLTFNVVIN
ncbi:MAG: hypothetical protein HZB82_05480 [Deltaproteobacteria bacterium]|nr:hypothetical protein [Deltaproteobacteria bacterium]